MSGGLTETAGGNLEANEASKRKYQLFSCVRLFANLQTVACQAPLSIEFSWQESQSGQPFPSPGYPPNPGVKSRSPTLQADSLPAESPVKSKNTGVGSLSLLQGVFPTQELNRCLLHCRQILYQLSYHEVRHRDTYIKAIQRHFKETNRTCHKHQNSSKERNQGQLLQAGLRCERSGGKNGSPEIHPLKAAPDSLSSAIPYIPLSSELPYYCLFSFILFYFSSVSGLQKQQGGLNRAWA